VDGRGRRAGHLIVVIVLSILGALLALWLERYVIIVATAFAGAQMAIIGGVALLTEQTVDRGGVAPRGLPRVPARPAAGTEWDLYGWIALGLLGVRCSWGSRGGEGHGAKGKG
jgi:hypothetical protein